MTLLVISPDYASHLLPLATLATAWRDRGHRVVVATGPSTAGIVESFGFERVGLQLGRGSNPGIIRADDQPDEEADSLRGFFDATREGMIPTLAYQARERLTDLMWDPVTAGRATLQIVDDLKPDAILIDHLAFSARLALSVAGHDFADVVLGHPSALPARRRALRPAARLARRLPPALPPTSRSCAPSVRGCPPTSPGSGTTPRVPSTPARAPRRPPSASTGRACSTTTPHSSGRARRFRERCSSDRRDVKSLPMRRPTNG